MKRFVALALLVSSLALAIDVGGIPSLPSSLTDSFKQNHALKTGTWKVFYFYPKAGTNGCTAQNIEYTKLYPEFVKSNTQVFGASSDDARSQCVFVANSKLKVPQIPSAQNSLAKIFDVGNLFGMLSRDTMIVAPSGQIAAIRRGVNPVSDAQEVLGFIQGNGDCKAFTSGANQCKR